MSRQMAEHVQIVQNLRAAQLFEQLYRLTRSAVEKNILNCSELNFGENKNIDQWRLPVLRPGFK